MWLLSLLLPSHYCAAQVRQATLEVEYPLIEGQLDEIDQQLQRALQELNWNSEGAWEYIQETRDKVRVTRICVT